jgi:hypothetical protein
VPPDEDIVVNPNTRQADNPKIPDFEKTVSEIIMVKKRL